VNNRLIEHIISDFRQYGKPILIVEDIHNTLERSDFIAAFRRNKIQVSGGNNLAQRLAYFTSDSNCLHIFIKTHHHYLEDILKISIEITFNLSTYLDAFHFQTIEHLSLKKLEELYLYKPIANLSKIKTEHFLSQMKINGPLNQLKLSPYLEKISLELEKESVNWHILVSLLSDIVIEDPNYCRRTEFKKLLGKVNDSFQEYLSNNQKTLINSNAINKPKIVSKVLDHIAFNYKKEKVALVVIDGMSYWQYKILSNTFFDQYEKAEAIIHSWVPSITQLSRQALFKGAVPDKDYIQNPTNEKKLWLTYWSQKGFSPVDIEYQHDLKEYHVNPRTKRLAIVFKDLDDKMHSSTDYADLKTLTKNWIKRSKIVDHLTHLIEDDFRVILTTDHGNVEAEGWRALSGREKLGTNKSGSRSQRHVEYTDSWLVNDFLEKNQDIKDSIARDEHAVYFKDNKSFSRENQLVTHGGSHIFEVLIPFIKIE